jgi:hypothetical protein
MRFRWHFLVQFELETVIWRLQILGSGVTVLGDDAVDVHNR